MKLYYKPLACSLAVHIALRELALPFDLARVTSEGGVPTADGKPYLDVHSLSSVPALALEDGTIMAEAAVMLEFLGQQSAETPLAPAPQDADYWDFRQVMNFIATDIHKNFGPMFHPLTPPEMKQAWVQRFDKRFGHLAARLDNQRYLMARGYTVADSYLYVMLFWCKYVNIDIASWPALAAYFADLSDRRATRDALAVEQPQA